MYAVLSYQVRHLKRVPKSLEQYEMCKCNPLGISRPEREMLPQRVLRTSHSLVPDHYWVHA